MLTSEPVEITTTASSIMASSSASASSASSKTEISPKIVALIAILAVAIVIFVAILILQWHFRRKHLIADASYPSLSREVDEQGHPTEMVARPASEVVSSWLYWMKNWAPSKRYRYLLEAQLRQAKAQSTSSFAVEDRSWRTDGSFAPDARTKGGMVESPSPPQRLAIISSTSRSLDVGAAEEEASPLFDHDQLSSLGRYHHVIYPDPPLEP